ncbi:uncharacterized protein si:dkey-19b23.8 isoform X1 [Sander lucioperca]|uniref:uncharacterized protein si:dkey-19b23.8 isoform X1 n=1 Tax=Sander lucioperca TaxID=283035 RepID=UPI0016538D3D|nr:uncharacterized protein si:dkey-19b23.8 isoform X1 [Sander lucioperca]
MKLWPDKSSGCNCAPFIEEKWKSGRGSEEDQLTTGRYASAKISSKPGLKRTMSLSTFHLMQTLKNSPAALRRRFRRDRTESLSHGDPLFKVHYLGTEKIFSLDREQAQDAISRLLEGIANGKKLSKDHALVVRPRYVEVKELSTGRQLTKTYLQDIAYCAADANRPNVFLYICKHQGQQLQCRQNSPHPAKTKNRSCLSTAINYLHLCGINRLSHDLRVCLCPNTGNAVFPCEAFVWNAQPCTCIPIGGGGGGGGGGCEMPNHDFAFGGASSVDATMCL